MNTQWRIRGRQLAILAIAVTTADRTLGFDSWRPTEFEMTMLPPYCKARFTPNNSEQYKYWHRILGRDFVHVHHFCAGLNSLLRSYKPQPKKERKFNLGQAEANFTTVINAFQPTFRLLPDAYLYRGIAISRETDSARAIPDLTKAIELNPGLVRGYTALADVYVDHKQKGKALEIITAGLRSNPGSPALQKRYTALGGTLPFPEPAHDSRREANSGSPEQPAVGEPSSSTMQEARAGNRVKPSRRR